MFQNLDCWKLTSDIQSLTASDNIYMYVCLFCVYTYTSYVSICTHN